MILPAQQPDNALCPMRGPGQSLRQEYEPGSRMASSGPEQRWPVLHAKERLSKQGLGRGNRARRDRRAARETLVGLNHIPT